MLPDVRKHSCIKVNQTRLLRGPFLFELTDCCWPVSDHWFVMVLMTCSTGGNRLRVVVIRELDEKHEFYSVIFTTIDH